jgi:hypothetical protein
MKIDCTTALAVNATGLPVLGLPLFTLERAQPRRRSAPCATFGMPTLREIAHRPVSRRPEQQGAGR